MRLTLLSATIGWVALFAGENEPGGDTPARWVEADFACPDGAEMRRAESPDGKYSALWCQLERGDRVARHGPYLELFADGTTARQGHYHRGVQAGRWIRWSESGEIVSEREIYPGEAGRHVLQPEDLCPPDTIRHRYRSLSDKSYLESDCLLIEGEEEVLHGPSVRWEEIQDGNGLRYALRDITEYRHGERHGRQLVFAGPSGRESLILEQSYVAGVLDGESRAYFLDGTLREVCRFEEGQLQGLRIGFYPDGDERWRLSHDQHGQMETAGDFTIDGEPCPERAVPQSSPDSLEIYCVRGASSFTVRDGPYSIRDKSGRVIERGRYDYGKKKEIWEAPPGVELPQQVSDQVLVAEAALMVDGRPYVEPSPSDIWFQNSDSRKYISPRNEVEDGRVRIFGLPPGNYYMQVRIDAVAANPELYPGDLMASAELTVREAEVASFDVDLLYTLRLLSPWDNAEHIPGMERRCGEYGTTPGPTVRFTWEPPPLEDLRGIEYTYYLWRKSCDPLGPKEKLLQEKTFDTSLEFELADSRATYYQFSLVAHRGGRPIGHLMSFGSDGSYGWSLNFHVGG